MTQDERPMADDGFITDLEEKFLNMRRIRERAGWSQQRVADVIGVDRTRVIRWEQGQPPSFEYTVKLSRLLDSLQIEALRLEQQDQ